jgi:hypothetical protein
MFSGKPKDPLSDILWTFPDGTVFTVRDLHKSIECKGITGSGKTTGVLAFILDRIVQHAKSTCLIICQKTDDRDFYKPIFDKHGKPLIIIEPQSDWRCNSLQSIGGDTQAKTEFLLTLREALEGSKARGQDAEFWDDLRERFIFTGIAGLSLAGFEVSAPNLQKFFSTAAKNPEQFKDATFLEGLHNKCLEAASARRRQMTEVELYDWEVVLDLWQNEYPMMDDKVQSGAMAGVMNTLGVFNRGIVRQFCSTRTNVSPNALGEGKSIMINFPPVKYGPAGRFLQGDWKYRVQQHILGRNWKPGDFWTVFVMDEYQQCVTEPDAPFLAMCRSAGACFLTLTQTIHSEYSRMGGGHASHHKVDSLLSQYGLHVFCTCDAATAKHAAELLGHGLETFVNVTPDTQGGIGTIFGGGLANYNVSQQYQPILQPRVFMSGLRSGGPPHFCVDSIAIKMGIPFNNGCNWQLWTHKQR